MKIVIAILAVFIAFVIGIGIYLTPNDLAGCGTIPGDKKGCEPADAIVAVSGGDTLARTHEAIALYKNGWASKLIFSGAAQDKSGPSNAEVMRREALGEDVPSEDIITEELSATTKENAENTKTIFAEHDISSVILVTSAYHQRRAGLEFQARAGGAVAVRNHPVARDNQWSSWWWATPTGWYLAIGELIKIIAFYAGGSR